MKPRERALLSLIQLKRIAVQQSELLLAQKIHNEAAIVSTLCLLNEQYEKECLAVQKEEASLTDFQQWFPSFSTEFEYHQNKLKCAKEEVVEARYLVMKVHAEQESVEKIWQNFQEINRKRLQHYVQLEIDDLSMRPVVRL